MSSSYLDMDLRAIFLSIVFDKNDMYRAWVEAENILAIREIISSYFDILETGQIEKVFPDPAGITISQDQANKLIEELDDDFNKEKGRWEFLQVTCGPEFKRFPLYARISLAQEVYSVILTQKQIEQEAERRKESKIELPDEIKNTFISAPATSPEFDPYFEV